MLCVLGLSVVPAQAAARFFRSMHEFPGIPPGFSTVGQDSDGYIWIVGDEGLTRFDGVEAIPWGEDVIDDSLNLVATGPSGQVCAGARYGSVYEVVGAGAARIVGPDGTAIRNPEAAVWTSDGALWLVSAGRVLRRSAAGNWTVATKDAFAGEGPRSLAPSIDPRSEGVWLGTYDGGLWWIDSSIASHPRARDLGGTVTGIVEEPGGSLVLGVKNLGVLRLLVEGGHEVLAARRPRPIALVRRGDSIWVSFSDAVLRIGDDGSVETLGLQEGMPGRGSLFVDRERNLWLGTGRGLRMFPEPNTRVWEYVEKARRIRRIKDGLWVTTWNGPWFLKDGAAEWTKYPIEPYWGAGDGCVDAQGRAWMTASLAVGERGDTWDGSALLRFDGTVVSRFRPRSDLSNCVCDTDSRGVTWFACDDGILRLESTAEEPERFDRVPDGGRPRAMVIDDMDRWNVLFDPGTLCRRQSSTDAWTCEELPDGVRLGELEPGPSGELWINTGYATVYTRTGGQWGQFLDRELLKSRHVQDLAASPSGGIWLTTARERVRLEATGDRLRVVERLTESSGVPSWSEGRVFEDHDGSLWIPSSTGIVHVPPQARERSREPPGVHFTSMRLDGNRMPPADGRTIPPDARRVELYFTSLSFRDARNIHYRMRLGGEVSWIPLEEPVVRFLDPPHGARTVQVAASRDGEHWSESISEISFTVAPPWYMQPFVWALTATGLLSLLYAAHRLRAEHLLRVERERTRIAFDLHDEMGAAVGSIGIMAGVAAADSTSAGDRREISAQVAEAATEAGAMLHDIVWSLRGRDQRLGALAAHLTDRGLRMFPTDEPNFSTDLPDEWPPDPLSASLQRTIQRVVVEGMHNVVRHARAAHVELGFARARNNTWTVWVEDDGIGVGAAAHATRGSGLGIDSMHKRAEEIGGTLKVGEREGGGTRVELTFDLRGRRRRFGSRNRARAAAAPGGSRAARGRVRN